MNSCPILEDAALDECLTGVLRRIFDGRENFPVGPGPVLILPPDITRIHSRAGFLAGVVCRELARYGSQSQKGKSWRLGGIMPALGTHRPLTKAETRRMFPQCPEEAFLDHRWREDTVELGRLQADRVAAAFGGGEEFRMDWPIQVNRILRDGLPAGSRETKPFSLIVSIGQVLPHEVAGMSGHGKNILIGAGGPEAINKSHWLGALYGLERLMGVPENPVRFLFDEALRLYGYLLPPVLWVLTVVDCGNQVRGLFCGFGRGCFEEAAALAEKLNIVRISREGSAGVNKIVVWLDGGEYRSTWLGNKAVYRTRRALAEGGELLILAPGLECFGEDPGLDTLIRRYGYRGSSAVRHSAAKGELAGDLSAAAHLIHGSAEGRFTIRYCTSNAGKAAGAGDPLGRGDIEEAGYKWGNLQEEAARYAPLGPEKQNPGWNTCPGGEEYYFIPNPGLGLWAAD